MKKLAIISYEENDVCSYILNYFSNIDVEISIIKSNDELFSSGEKFDLVILFDNFTLFNNKNIGRVLNVHPSILPAFDVENSVKVAYLSGVKLSGVTISLNDKDFKAPQIVAQYPVFIESCMHLDEFEDAILNIEKRLYPLVIDSVLNEKIFDFQDLIRTNKTNNCSGGCENCHH